MKKHILLLLVALLSLTASAEYRLGTIDVTLPGGVTSAVARIDDANRLVVLGNGYNSCIPYWSRGGLVIPGSVSINGVSYKVEVGPVAFRLCNGLTRITIQEGVQQIDDYAFVGCSSVQRIDLPSTLTTIKRGAFVNMKALKLIICKAETAPTWEFNDIFASEGTLEATQKNNTERNLFVPQSHTESYKKSKYNNTVGWEDACARIYEYSNEPTKISSLAEFKAFRDAVNDGTLMTKYASESFELTTDIVISEEHITTEAINHGKDGNWTPIGSESHPFSGIFNGGGHTIKNMAVKQMDNGNDCYAGLFGCAQEAIIYNLHLDAPAVLGADYVGSVLGYASTNTHVTDILVTCLPEPTYDSWNIISMGSGGGIVGVAENATIERCYFDGSVRSRGWGGGIIGNVGAVTVSDCSASGEVINSFFYVYGTPNVRIGGIVGGTYKGGVTMKRCSSRVNLRTWMNPGDGAYAGYLLGKPQDGQSAVIENSVYWECGYPDKYYNDDKHITFTNCKSFSTESDMRGGVAKNYLGDNWTYFTDSYQDYAIPTTLAKMYLKDIVLTDASGLVYRPVGSKNAPTAYVVEAYTGSSADVTIPDTYKDKPVTAILEEVFKANEVLKTIKLGANLQTIGKSAFEDCDLLTAIDLPDAVNMVKRDAFRGCDNLVSFNIGKGFKDHEGNFLAYCPKLTTLTASRGNDNRYLCVDNVLIHNVSTYRSYVIVCAPGKTGDYVIPVKSLTNSTVNVFTNCFASCDGLTSITFPAGKKYSFGSGVFDGAYNLRYVDMSAISGTIDDAKYKVDRNDAETPFYGMSDNTMIYMPGGKGHTAAINEPNVIIGGEAQGGLILHEDWGFKPLTENVKQVKGVTMNRDISSERTIINYIVTDDEGNEIEAKDENGNPIVVNVYNADGTPQMEEDGVTPKTTHLPEMADYDYYIPRLYTVCLPYDLEISAADDYVFTPTKVDMVEGVPTFTFVQLKENNEEKYELKANRPYVILAVGKNPIDLSTDKTIETMTFESSPVSIGGFEFKGTMEQLQGDALIDASKPFYVMQSDGSWKRIKEGDTDAVVAPFSAYFQAKSPTIIDKIAVIFEDNYPVITLDEKGDNTAILKQYEGQRVNVVYDRVLAATKIESDKWASRAYTVCLPYNIDLLDHENIQVYRLIGIKDNKEFIFTNDFADLEAGEPYLIVVNEGFVPLSARGVRVISEPSEGDEVTNHLDSESPDYKKLGRFKGTFKYLSNDECVAQNAYGMSADGKWRRYRNDKPQYQKAYACAFRCFFSAIEPMGNGVYATLFEEHEEGEEEFEITKFPAEVFSGDADFSGYDDEGTGIILHTIDADGTHRYFDMQGRPLDGKKPTKRGLYIINGKKVVVK